MKICKIERDNVNEVGECEYAVIYKTGQGRQNRSPYPKIGETAIFLTKEPKKRVKLGQTISGSFHAMF